MTCRGEILLLGCDPYTIHHTPYPIPHTPCPHTPIVPNILSYTILLEVTYSGLLRFISCLADVVLPYISAYAGGRGERNGGDNPCGMAVPGIFQLPAHDVSPPIMVTDQCGPGSVYLNDVSPSTCDSAGIVTPPGETDPARQKTYWPLSLGSVPPAVPGLTLEQLNLRRVDMCSNEL